MLKGDRRRGREREREGEKTSRASARHLHHQAGRQAGRCSKKFLLPEDNQLWPVNNSAKRASFANPSSSCCCCTPQPTPLPPFHFSFAFPLPCCSLLLLASKLSKVLAHCALTFGLWQLCVCVCVSCTVSAVSTRKL